MIKLARAHHYMFAHKLLPLLFFKEPERFMSGMKKGCHVILGWWWNEIGSSLKKKERIALNGFRFRSIIKEYKYYRAYFVEMPEAKFAPEAIIVAFVIIKVPEKEEIKAQYYTIDANMEPRPTNQISSSGTNGCHTSFRGCVPNIKDFAKRLHVITSYPICKMRGRKYNFRYYDKIFYGPPSGGKVAKI